MKLKEAVEKMLRPEKLTDKFRLRVVEAVGSRKSTAFVDYADRSKSGVEQVEVPVYPSSPDGERLRAVRIERELGLRETAEGLGIRPSELSGLEMGRLSCDWPQLMAALRDESRFKGRR